MTNQTSKKNVFIWSPFTSKIGTTQNIINNSYSLVKYSYDHQFNIKIINAFGEWDNYTNELKKKKIDIHNFKLIRFLKNWKKVGFFKSRFVYFIIFLLSFIPMFFLIKKNKPDFLIIHLITSLPLIIFSVFNFKTKLILHMAGHPKLNFMRKTVLKIASKKVFKVICPSNELKDILINENIFDDKQISVIEDSHIEIKKIQYLKKIKIEDDFFRDTKVLISIGRMTKQKDYNFLIKNFKKLSIKYSDIKLLIIGDGEEKNSLINLIKKLNLENKIKLLNYEPNIYKYLSRSNFYISTSIWEGSSLAMIDAAFIGIPILCSDCPSGRKEFIGNDERGFIYKQGNDEDFLKKFSIMYSKKPENIKDVLVNAKKETKKFTLFKNFLSFQALLKY